MEDKSMQRIKFWSAISVVAIILIAIVGIMVKYEVEGDKNMPFNLTKIVAVSTAEGVETKGKSKWNFKIFQNNDLYFYIDKNENYRGKDTVIDSISIENIQILDAPNKGSIKTYMPNSVEGRLFDYKDNYLVENSLTYKGASKSNPQKLEISSQGGNMLVSFCNTELGKYSSNKDLQIVHDGTLLKKLKLKTEDLKFKVSFDFIISVTNSKYKANIIMDLPYGDILKNGTESIEKTDMSDLIFKRVK